MCSALLWAMGVAVLSMALAATALAGPMKDTLEEAATSRMGPTFAEDAAAGAEAAARRAWVVEASAKKVAQGNLKFVPLVKAEIAMAKSAADTAAEKDRQATKLYDKTQASTRQAAMRAAHEYLAEVREAAAEATVQAGDGRQAAEEAAEVAAGRAAAQAALPYHANLLRLQRLTVDYEQHAQAMAAASNNLKGESSKLAAAAQQYQSMGQTVQATQMMVTAHSLLSQGERLKKEAKKLDGTARELYDALPFYQQAEQAAAENAAAAANPAILTPGSSLLPY